MYGLYVSAEEMMAHSILRIRGRLYTDSQWRRNIFNGERRGHRPDNDGTQRIIVNDSRASANAHIHTPSQTAQQRHFYLLPMQTDTVSLLFESAAGCCVDAIRIQVAYL